MQNKKPPFTITEKNKKSQIPYYDICDHTYLIFS